MEEDAEHTALCLAHVDLAAFGNNNSDEDWVNQLSEEKFKDLKEDMRFVQNDTHVQNDSRTQNDTHTQIHLTNSTDRLVGSILDGRYEILSRIGQGGMGSVYKAKQLATDRIVAIKLIDAANVTEDQVRRFSNEGKAACAFHHANAVAIYDVSVTSDGIPYLSMQYVDGVALSDEIETHGPLTETEGVQIFSQISDALACAHGKRVLHRDIKPGNIMLVKDRTGQRAGMLLDFGIAKLSGDAELSDATLTKTGEFVGTPFYMSPEQCQGGKADQRSDVYALGCVMYEAFTGAKPVMGDNFLHVLTNHVQTKPIPLSQYPTGKTLTKPLQAIIYRALEKNPADRFQSMSELCSALKHPDHAKHSSSKNIVLPSSLFADHRNRWMLSAICLLTVVAAATVFTFAGQNKPFQSKKNWPDEFSTAIAQWKAGDKTAAEIEFAKAFTKLNEESKIKSTPEEVAASAQKIVSEIDPKIVYQQVGEYYLNLKQILNPQREKYIKAACEILRVGRESGEPECYRSYGVAMQFLGGEYQYKGNIAQSIQAYRKSIEIFKEMVKANENVNPPPRIDTYERIAEDYHEIGNLEKKVKPEEAQADYASAEEWFVLGEEKILKWKPDWAVDGQFYIDHADNLLALGKADEAIKFRELAKQYAIKKQANKSGK